MDNNFVLLVVKSMKLIKEGIESEDWNKVSDGYELISGEKIVPKKKEDMLFKFRNLLKTEKISDEKKENTEEVFTQIEDIEGLEKTTGKKYRPPKNSTKTADKIPKKIKLENEIEEEMNNEQRTE